jgi:hypothetical protein
VAAPLQAVQIPCRGLVVQRRRSDDADSATNTFRYTRDDNRFEQVMACFWVNQAQEYLPSLGFGSTLRPVNAESQDVRINQYGVDNSFSWDKHEYIRLARAASTAPRTAR